MATEGSRRSSMLPEFSKTKQLEWKRKMMVFSFFLAISIIIWMLNALSKNYTSEIKYPISYSRFPENKVLVSEVPEYLTLKVNAHGYALLSYKLSNRPIPINFPVSSFAMNRLSGDSATFYLLTRYAREQVARQLPAELQLLEIAPDSLIFKFATEISRKVPVKPMINFKIAKGFIIKDAVSIVPDSVMVSGPDVYLDTLKEVLTRKKTLGILEKSYSEILMLQSYPGFNFNNESVECSIELEKITGVQIKVPIQVNGLPDSLRMQTFPQEVSVNGNIGLSNYDRIVPEAFWIEVMYDEVMQNQNRLQIYMRTKPDELISVDFYPQTVEYLLSVK